MIGYNEYPSPLCVPKFEKINEFNNRTLKWKNETLLFEWKKFHYCPIFIDALPDLVDSNLLKVLKRRDGILEINGIFGELSNIFAQKYSLTITQFGISTGARRYDLRMNTISVGFKSVDLINHRSFPLIFRNFIFLVVRGPKHSTYEKMMLPFDDFTWMSILIVFFLGIASILIIAKMPKRMQSFVFGINNRDPLLGMTQIFFGLGRIRVPGRFHIRLSSTHHSSNQTIQGLTQK